MFGYKPGVVASFQPRAEISQRLRRILQTEPIFRLSHCHNYSALRGSERAVVQFPMLLIQTLNYNDVV